MTNKEVLYQIVKMISSGELPKEVYDKYLSDCPIGFMDTDTLFDYLSQDTKLVESLKRVLSKVVNTSYYEEVKREDGFTDYCLKREYKIGEDFDVEFFKDIIDQLGYELVKKEDK